MIYLIISIALTASIFWIFKWHSLKGTNINVCVASNYVIAGSLGFIINRNSIQFLSINISENLWPVLVMGVLFIIIFLLIGKSTNESGVGMTVMASKLSVLITILFSFLIFKDVIGLRTIIAFPLAVVSIVLYQWSKNTIKPRGSYVLPVLVLVGSGVVDFFLAWLSKYSDWPTGLNASVIFSTAAVVGVLFVAFRRFRIKRIDILIGIVLGILNYGSIHYFLIAFKSTTNNPLYFLIFSIGTLLLSSIGSVMLFKEKLNKNKIAALGLAICALLLAH